MAKCDKVDYSKSMIYKLCCKNPEIKEIYVGSTTNLIKRKYQHKSDCYNEKFYSYNSYKYQFIRSNGGFENFHMVLIENYPCDSKQELHKRERYWLEQLDSKLNSYKPYISEEEKKEQTKEWIEKNNEQHKELVKKYQEKHKEEIKEYQKNYREKQKEKKLELENLKLYFNILRMNKKFNV